MSETNQQVHLAIDLGAESGRVVAGVLNNGALELTEVHRFPNGPTETGTGLRWDFTELYKQITQGLTLAAGKWGGAIVSIGVDTWGVDYGLINADGNLLAEPQHYRDNRTDGMQDEAFKLVPRREIYNITGIQFLPFNTIFQLLAESRADTPAYKDAKHLLMVPDLINHRLTGRLTNELTDVSTSQLLDARTRRWSTDLLQKLQLRNDLFCDLVAPGETIGTLTPDVAKQTGLSPNVRVIAVGSHDTASAVAGVPASGDGWAYLSSGTWSLLGIEVAEPVINDTTYEHGFTNEAGVLGTIRLLKNIAGLWLLQECRRQWQREGYDYSYAQLTDMAEQAQPFARVIDTDDPAFAAPGDMPARIDAHLVAKGQQPCEDHARMTRSILESLAAKYRDVFRVLEACAGKRLDTLHIVGGGTQNRLLNQFTANAVDRRVVTGPVEATATGNVLMQMVALGVVKDLPAARAIIRNQAGIAVYEPQ